MANQIFGSAAVAVHMYQALYGKAPSNALYQSYVAQIGTSDGSAFAKTMASAFDGVGDSALALQVLNNLGITAVTVPATGEYAKLLAALTQAFAAFPTMRGQVILNATNLFGNLENDATYGAAAATYNSDSYNDFVYASNTTHTAPGTPNNVIALSDANTAANAVAENSAVGTTVGVTALAVDAGAALSYSLIESAGGKFAINPVTGVVTVAGALDYETATSHSIIVQATSSDGSAPVTQTYTIAVTNVNDNAVSAVTDSNTATNTVAENSAVGTVVGLTALATDADGGATITYSLSDNAGGKFAINATTGVVTVNGALDFEALTSHSVTVLATSSDGSTNSQAFTIAVTNVNDVAPVFTSAATLAATEDTAATYTATATDVDSTAVTFTAAAPAHGTVAAGTAAGTFVYTPSLNYNGTDSFVVTASDGLNTTTQTVAVTVAAVNDAPVFAAAAQAVAATEDTAATVTVAATDVDNTTVAYTAGAAAHGTVAAGTAAGTFVYTPALNYNGTDSFVVTATDAAGATATQTINLTIAAVNDAPVITSAATLAATEDVAVTYTVTATDVDNTSVTATAGTASHGTVVAGTSAGAFVYTPTLNYNGTDSFTVTVADGSGGTASQTVAVTVAAVNDAPVVATTASAYTISSGTTAVTTVTGSDVDGTTPTFTKSGPDAAKFTINPTTGALAFATAPDFNFAGSAAGTNTYSVTVGATDGALTGTKDITVSVSQLPIPTYTLTATSVDDVAQGAAVSEGKSVTYTVTASAAVTGTTVIPITVTGAGSTAANIGSAAPTSVTIPAGATTASFTINVLEDKVSDNGAVITVALGNTATITGTSASAVQVYANSLLDRVAPKSTAELNVDPATLTVTQSAASISEAAGSSVLTFTLSKAMSNDTVITLNAADSAGAAAAHSTVPASVTIAAGALTGSLTVTGVDNTTYDGATARTLTLVPTANNAVLSGLGAVVTITDNEVAPAVSTAVATAATIAEGGTASWTVTLNNASSVAYSVPYTITGVGATTGNLSFAAGETSKVLTLATPAVDGLYNGNLTSTLAVGSLTSAVAVTEGNPLTVSVAATGGATSVNEGSNASFTISTNLPTGTVVNYTIAGTSGAADHAGVSGTTAVNSSGQAVISFATTADYLTEGAETVTMTATSGSTTSTAASLTINDTTLTPTFSITGGAATLENASATYTVSLVNGNPTQAYTVDLAATGSGGATAADWGTITATGATLVGSTLTFAAGATSATISVPIARDSYTPESGEGVKLTLSNATGGTAVVGSTNNATVAITDVAPVFTVAPAVNALDEGGTAVTFTITSTIPMSADQTFTWTLLGATNTSTFTSAATTSDFVLNSSSVTMLAGATTATFTVSALSDTTTEGLEGFTANVFNASNSLVAQSGMVSINDLSTGNDAVQTFVLTTGPNNFTGLNANDSFDGITNANSLNSADTLTGGAGTSDTINATLTTAAQVIRPTLATIEKIILTATGSATLDLSSSTGYDALTSQLSTAALTFDNIGTATTAGTVISNQTGVATSVTYKYTNAALSSSADTMALTVTGFGNGGNDETIFVARAAGATNALETVAMTGATLANDFDLDLSGSAATTLSIAGSVNETVKVINPTTLTTINAGTSSGANVLVLNGVFAGTVTGGTSTDSLTLAAGTNTLSVSSVNSITGAGGNDAITVTDTAATTIIGGAGDDKLLGGNGNTRFDLSGGLDVNDTVTGGTGTNTLVATAVDIDTNTDLVDANDLVGKARVTNIQTLNVTGAGALGGTDVLINANRVASTITTINSGAVGGFATTFTMNTGTSTLNLSGVLGAATHVIAAAGTGAADTVNVVNTNTAAANTFAARNLTLTGVETIGLNSGATATLAQSTGAIGSTGTGTNPALTVNVTGANAFSLGAVTQAGTGLVSISGSGLTAQTAGTTTFTVAAPGGTGGTVSITGSAGDDNLTGDANDKNTINGGTGNDTITGGSANDVLNGEAGKDTITGGGGNDSINGGSEDDRIVFAADLTTDDSVDGGTGTNTLAITSADGSAAGAAYTNVSNIATIEVTNQVVGNINAAFVASSATRINLVDTVTNLTDGTARTITGVAGNFTVGLGSTTTTDKVLGGDLVVAATGTGTADNLTLVNSSINTTTSVTTSSNVFNGKNVTSTGYENVTIQMGTDSTSPQDVIATLNVNPTTASSPVSLTLTGSNDFKAGLATTSTGLFTVSAAQINGGLDATWLEITGTASGTAGTQSITGSDGNDKITVGNFRSTILGGLGTDSLTGNAAADSIDGGAANDTITGGGGNDTLIGGTGNDIFVLANNLTANVVINGGADTADVLKIDGTTYVNADFAGVTGVEQITFTAAGALTLGANANTSGVNTISGFGAVSEATATDVVVVGAGFTNALTYNLGVGKADIDATASAAALTVKAAAASFTAADSIDGGTGTGDVLSILADNSGVGANLSAVTGFETITVRASTTPADVVKITLGADTVVAANTTLVVNASALTDTGAAMTFTAAGLTTATKSVSVTGGAGADVLTGGAGNDTFNVATGDSVDGGTGNNTINFSGAITAATAVGGAGNDTITFAGAVTNATLTGGGGTDTLTFNGATNTASKINGFASVYGGSGVDDLTFITAAQTVTYAGNGGADKLNFSAFGGSTNTVNASNATGTLSITGGAGNDIVTVTGAGNATIIAGAGIDSLSGGSGTNTYSFAGGALTSADTIVGGAGADTVLITTDGGGTDMTKVTGVETVSVTGDHTQTITLSAGVTNLTGDAAGVQVITLGAAQTTALAVDLGGNSKADQLKLAAGPNTGLVTATGVSIVTGSNSDDKITVTTASTINADAGAGNGNDWLIGSSGADTFVFTDNLTAVDTITGNGGADTIKYKAINGTIDLSGATGITTLDLTTGAYTGTVIGLGSAGATSVTGGGSNQQLTFTGTLTGVTFDLGTGTDKIALASGTNNSVSLASVDISITGGDGGDTIAVKTGVTATTTVDGGIGTDTLVFSNANLTVADVKNVESITGSSGIDTLTFSIAAAATMTGGGGADVVALANATNSFAINTDGTGGTVSITGNAGADTITVSGAGAATILGGSGTGGDSLTGGNADDTFKQVIANMTSTETIVGGSGNDTLAITDLGGAGGVKAINLTKVTGVEYLTLTNGTNDFTDGITWGTNTSVTSISGSTGADSLTFAGTALSNVTINGGGGADVIQLGASNNAVTYTGMAVQSSITGGSGNDSITVSGAVAVSIGGGTGNDTLIGGSAADTFTGGAGADSMTGNAGADVFKYAAATDSTGTNADTITDFTTSQGDVLQLSLTVPTTNPLLNANVFTFTNLGTITSTQLNTLNPLTDLAGETLFLSDLNQLVVDTNGDGQINGSDYRITLSNAAGVSPSLANVGFVLTLAGTNASTVIGGTGADSITGGTSADSLVGGAGNDVIVGGGGADTIYGGSGTDTITVSDLAATAKIYFSALTDAGDTINGFDNADGTADDLIIFSGTLRTSISANTVVDSQSSTGDAAVAITVGTNTEVVFELTAHNTGATAVVTADLSDLTKVAAELTQTFTVTNGAGADLATLFVLQSSDAAGKNTGLYLWTPSSATDTSISVAELTLIGVVNATSAVMDVNDFNFV